jgi:hypothetical protein
MTADPHGTSGAGGEPGPDAVEQFQRAVLTVIGAARVALDALETLVADRSRLDELASGGRDLVGSVLGNVFGRAGAPSGDRSDPPNP